MGAEASRSAILSTGAAQRAGDASTVAFPTHLPTIRSTASAGPGGRAAALFRSGRASPSAFAELLAGTAIRACAASPRDEQSIVLLPLRLPGAAVDAVATSQLVLEWLAQPLGGQSPADPSGAGTDCLVQTTLL